jgi:hypothetical protein
LRFFYIYVLKRGFLVVYKVDRLTRSLADFAEIVEQLDVAACKPKGMWMGAVVPLG